MFQKALIVFLIGIFLTGGSPGQAVAAPAAPTFTVNSFADAAAATPYDNGVCETLPSNGICTLRAAIMKANHYAGGGVTINLPAGTAALSILPTGVDDELTGDLNITNTMTINGVSAASTIIDANSIDGVIFIGAGVTVTISSVTITHGAVSISGGGISSAGTLTLNNSAAVNNHASFGGGINGNHSTTTLNNSVISANRADNWGGGINTRFSSLLLNNSTVNNNVAANGGGGGIFLDSSAGTMVNSTVSNNAATEAGGGIYVGNCLCGSSSLSASYSTIVGNVSNYDGEGAASPGGGIYIDSGATTNFKGVLIAQNYANGIQDDCNGALASQGYNLIQTTTGCTITGVATGNVTNIADALVDSQKNNGDAEASAPDPNFLGSALPNWLVIGENEVMIPYEVTTSVTGLIKASDPGPSDRGYGLFAGGGSTHAVIYQIKDVTSIAAAIDAQKVHYDLSAWVGGKTTQDDYAVWEAVFRTSPSGSTIQVVNVPDPILVQAAQRGNQTKLLFRGTTGVIPVGTRDIDLYLVLQRVSAADGYDDGYADNLSLMLWTNRLYLPLILR